MLRRVAQLKKAVAAAHISKAFAAVSIGRHQQRRAAACLRTLGPTLFAANGGQLSSRIRKSSVEPLGGHTAAPAMAGPQQMAGQQLRGAVPGCLRLRQRTAPCRHFPKLARPASKSSTVRCSAAGSPRAGRSGVQCSARAGLSQRPALELQQRDIDEAQPLSLSDWDRLRLKRAAGQSKIVPFRRKLRTPSGAPRTSAVLVCMVSKKKQKATKYLFKYPALLGAASACASLCRSNTRTVCTQMSLLTFCAFGLHAESKPEAQVAVIEPELIPERVVLEPEVLPAEEDSEQAADWKAVVGLSALLAMICSVDRAAMSVALGPMVSCC